jgi:spore coat polysaccharide biosynthesis protein SpsF
MKKAIFITVRTSSTRLPKKCLLEINGKKNIEFLIERLKHSKKADGIIVCTTTNPADDILESIAKKMGVACFRGSEEDKIARWMGAAEKFGVELIVTADGDDLFCEPKLIDLAFEQFERTGCDFIEEKPGANVPIGGFTYGIRVKALKKVCEIKGSNNTEMMYVYFTETGLFKVETLQNIPPELRKPEIRMTLDYGDDFKFFKNIIMHFAKKKYFDLFDILKYLDEHPEVIKINQYLNEQFHANQKAKTKLVLKKK